MTTKYITDIRKIAKTDELLKRIPNNRPDSDKAPIGKRRGVGFADDAVFNPCQLLYTSTDGVYSFADIVDGKSLKIQDGTYNHCTQLNTITGMRETGSSPTLKMTLKPDGVFFKVPDGTYLYSIEWLLIDDILKVFHGLPDGYPPPNYWAFTSAQDAADFRLTRLIALDTLYTDHSITDLEPVTLTKDLVAGWNYSVDFPVFSFNTISSGYIGPGTQPDPLTTTELVFSVPNSYDYTIPPAGFSAGTYLQYPTMLDDDITMAYQSNLPGIPNDNSFQLRIRVENDKLWVPNPLETGVPIKYKNGVSIVTFEFGAGYTRKGVVHPAKDGGFLLYETSGGTPIGNVYVFRQDRTLTTVVPVAQMAAYLP